MHDPFTAAFVLFSKISQRNPAVCRYSRQKMMVVDLVLEVSQHGPM
jgi:hypothetical protein